jgi:hypothetical protein
MSKPLPVNDPAYWMLERGLDETNGTGTWVTPKRIHMDGCYICEDPEFALMGLPLCKPCTVVIDGVECGEHVPADDEVCTLGHNAHETKGQSYEDQ